jgi:hypothetical protein
VKAVLPILQNGIPRTTVTVLPCYRS